MSSKKRALGSFVFCLILQVTLQAATCPSELHQSIVLLQAQLPRIPSGFRMQIMCLSTERHIDPLPSESNFESHAAFVLNMDPSCYLNQITDLLGALKSASWEPVPNGLEGSAKWCVRVVGNWNAVLMDIYIDRDRNLARYNGIWYKVEEKTLKKATTDAIQFILSPVT